MIVWNILAHRRQRLPTAPLVQLHKLSAALPAGPTLGQTCLSGTWSLVNRVDSVYKPCCCIQCALLQLQQCLHDMSTHRRSIDRDSAECSRSEAALCIERMCYGCDSTEHLANDLACPKMASRSRAAMQQRAETLNDALKRELLELCAERAYLHKNSSRA